MTYNLWLSCKKFTILVEVSEGKIVKAAPSARKFIGQPIENLKRWAKRFGGYIEKRLN